MSPVSFRYLFIAIAATIFLTVAEQGWANQCSDVFRESAGIPHYLGQFDLEFQGTKVRLLSGERLDADRNEYVDVRWFVTNDRAQGARKRDVFRELGFQLESQSDLSAPTWLKLATLYRAALSRRSISKQDAIVPAIVLFRSSHGQREYRLIDPLSESFPPESDGFKILSPNDEFNIPYSVIASNLANGKFPLMDATHDVSHFVAFLEVPSFAKAVASSMKKMNFQTTSPGFKRRMFWLLESLSIPDPAASSRIETFLSKRKIESSSSLSKLEVRLRQMQPAELLAYTSALGRFYESILADISGGNSNSVEKFETLAVLFSSHAGHAAEIASGKFSNISGVISLEEAFIENRPPRFRVFEFQTGNETSLFSFATVATSIRALSTALKGTDAELAAMLPNKLYVELFDDPTTQNTITRLRPGVRERLTRLLIKVSAIAEYSMLRSRELTPDVWANSFLRNDLPEHDPIAKFLKEVFPNDLVRHKYLNDGRRASTSGVTPLDNPLADQNH